MSDSTGVEGTYRVHTVEPSSSESLANAYAKAATDGEITASVWDGHRVNIITRTGGESSGRTYRAISAKSGTPSELEQSLAEALAGGGRVVSAVWDGTTVNLIVEG